MAGGAYGVGWVPRSGTVKATMGFGVEMLSQRALFEVCCHPRVVYCVGGE